jgi:tetratricopeptide (TPR) repeat protein
MKNKEKKHSASQFPNIYRFITESTSIQEFKKTTRRLLNKPKIKKIIAISSVILLFLTVVILILGISISGIGLYKYYRNYKQIAAQRENLQSQINFWQSIADKYDGYKDAYFRIALLEYQLSDFQKAKDANTKALLLDPNFDDARKLEVVLDKK